LLAGMVNSPSRFDPYAHPEAAKARRDVVLDAMVEAGSLPAPAARDAKDAALGVLPGGPRTPAGNCLSASPEAGFFCAYAVDYLERHGVTAEQLATGGLTVRTTMDPQVGRVAKQAVEANVRKDTAGVANTMAIIRPGEQRHEVLAMVANRDYGLNVDGGERSTDIVGDVSDPFGAGSVFKIFTAAAALESGEAGLRTPLPNPDSRCFTPPRTDRHAPCYPVGNLGHYPDPITLADALATSPNVAFVGLEQRVGVPAVLDMARRLGLRRTLAANAAGGSPVTDRADPRADDPRYNQPQAEYFHDLLSFTLGTSPVSPLELANVSATLMSGGVWCPPDPIPFGDRPRRCSRPGDAGSLRACCAGGPGRHPARRTRRGHGVRDVRPGGEGGGLGPPGLRQDRHDAGQQVGGVRRGRERLRRVVHGLRRRACRGRCAPGRRSTSVDAATEHSEVPSLRRRTSGR
jgi:membrane peptidoglycan carboxypeptidase